jgi:hypothetical protein
VSCINRCGENSFKRRLFVAPGQAAKGLHAKLRYSFRPGSICAKLMRLSAGVEVVFALQS